MSMPPNSGYAYSPASTRSVCLSPFAGALEYDDEPGTLFSVPTPLGYGHDCESSVRSTSVVVVGPQESIDHRRTFLPWEEWEVENIYDEPSTPWIRYSVRWKVTSKTGNRKEILATDTEQNVVVAPTHLWQQVLRPRLTELLRKKFPPPKTVDPDDTNVTVVLEGRPKQQLTKRYEGLEVNWSEIEKQLVLWGSDSGNTRALRVELCINYVETSIGSSGGKKRGRGSASERRHVERNVAIEAEEGATGRASTLYIYRLFHCPGTACGLGPYCFVDSQTTDKTGNPKHYRVRNHHFKGLVGYYEKGGPLNSHDDVPDDLRQQFYADDAQSVKHKRAGDATASTVPAININLMSDRASVGTDSAVIVESGQETNGHSRGRMGKRLRVIGPRDVAVKKYLQWQQTQVEQPFLKAQYQQAHDVIVEKYGYSLQQIYDDQNPSFLTNEGILDGVARQIISDVDEWVESQTGYGNEELRNEELESLAHTTFH